MTRSMMPSVVLPTSERYDSTHRTYDLTRLPVGVEQIVARLSARGELGQHVVFDGGCGTGLYLEALMQCGVGTLIGIDMSKTGVAQTAAKVGNRRGVEVRIGDIRANPLPDESCSAVIYNFVLHHVGAGRTDAIREAARVLKPGGELMIGTCSEEQLCPERGCMWYYHYFPEGAAALWARFPTVSELESDMRESGITPLGSLRAEPVRYTLHSFDVEGPFDPAWRAGDSMFSFYYGHPNLLQASLERLRADIVSGEVRTVIERTVERTERIKQATFLVGERSVTPRR